MRSMHQLRVDEFMRKATQDVPTAIVIPDAKIRKLRAKLILEEALETIEALGCEVEVCVGSERVMGELERQHSTLFDPRIVVKKEADIVKVVDGCCDLKVVTTGTLSAFGIEDEPYQEMVDYANLRKFGPGGRLGSDGKWIKPPDFIGPDEEIKQHLRDAGGLP